MPVPLLTTKLNPSEVVKTPLHRIHVSSTGNLNCPRKYLIYRIQRQWDDRELVLAVAHGQAVHKVNQAIYNARRGYELDLTRIEAYARDAVWSTVYPQDTDRDQAVARVIQSVRAFCDNDDEEAIEGTLDLERQGQFVVKSQRTQQGLFLASGKLDRTLVRASEPKRGIVRESKTTRQKISLQESFLMLWIFRKMYPRLGFTSWGIEYDFLDTKFRVVRVVVDWEDVRSQSPILLAKAMRVLQADTFPEIQGDQYTYCRRREICSTLQDVSVDLDALTNPELAP